MIVADAVVLVTGSSAGIGRACAAALAARDARVILHGRDADRLDAVAADLGAKAVRADLTLPGAPESVAAAALEVFGRVDAVVHCAGIGWYGPVADMPAGTVEELLAVNVGAPVRITQALLPGMLERGSGHVTFLASIAGWTGVANEAVYAGAKAALITFADSLRMEAAGRGIGVSVVSPAAVRTEFFTHRGTPYSRAFPRPIAAERVAAEVVRGIETGRPHRMLPRWLAIAPVVRTTLPGPFRALNQRFGRSGDAPPRAAGR